MAASVPLAIGSTEVSSVAAGATKCTIAGTPGADTIVGTGGPDVICGRGGDDVLVGGGGRDILIGGRGGDELRGGSQADRLVGASGNDFLDGGPQADDVNGGPGTNVCTLDSTDVADRCVYDEAPPAADQLSFSETTVDVTSGGVEVTARLHVTDDTGVQDVMLKHGDDTPWFPRNRLDRVSGTARDGWYEGTLEFARWSKPGTFVPSVRLTDRLGRRSTPDFSDQQITVLDDDPDLDEPLVELISPTPDETIDLRESGQSITVKAHITDAQSGVAWDRLGVDIWSPRTASTLTYDFGGGLKLISGDIHDGIWMDRFDIRASMPGGQWNIGIYASDRASGDVREARVIYWGPDEYPYRRFQTSEGDNRPFPFGMGAFSVLGRTQTDFTAPTADSLMLSTDTVDTLGGPAKIDFTVHAADAGVGVDGVSIMTLTPTYDPSNPAPVTAGADLVAGTPQDGTWSGSLVLPQGTPPGTYYLQVGVMDMEWNEQPYVSSGYPFIGSRSPLEENPTITIVDSSH
ncbi:hypothetical protein GCM10022242_10180 [Nocardioides panacisoli]|uniref:Calcium-binding protein n=2 Tax=Nocardioides panacisoli TaxID=627624 RepID=A0ABP7I188_9ACTN